MNAKGSERLVYLDNNATTPMMREARKALAETLLDGNASSMYGLGRKSKAFVEDARKGFAELLGCDSDEVIFTSGATESNDTVLNIAKRLIREKGGGRIVSSSIEHPSIIETLKHLKNEEGIDYALCPVDQGGMLRIDALEKELKKGDVVLTTVMAANNETGVIQPIGEACALAHECKSLFHTDATQILGKSEFGFAEGGFDYASCSAHKFYGPKGVGALVVKKGVPFFPFLTGGHQEDGKRSGTYNSTSVYAAGIAARIANADRKKEAGRLGRLRDYLRKGLMKKVPDISFNGDDKHLVPNTLNVSFRNVEGESILLMLDFDGICVSTGSACATGSLEPSYVLLASGKPIEDAHSSIRFSLGRENTKKDIDYVLEKLPPIIERLRQISTRGRK
ncbi:MAG TPA: cysteine desulfurase NifS [Spirochaetaceae bacterium]|nr:cysteine desulfurase NifS [Spirochaetaceae bacterium]